MSGKIQCVPTKVTEIKIEITPQILRQEISMDIFAKLEYVVTWLDKTSLIAS